MKFLTLVSLAVAAAAPTVAAALPADGVPSKRIAYRDADLASPEGKAALQHRIDRAIAVVCQIYDTPTLLDRVEAAKCARAAVASTHQQMMVAVARAGSDRLGNDMVVAAR